MEQGHQNARTRSTDGMAERNRTTMHVHTRRIERQLLDDGQGLRGKGFVDFPKIDVVLRPAGFLQRPCRQSPLLENLIVFMQIDLAHG